MFIVADEEKVTNSRRLSGLEEIELLASIVHVNRRLELPEPDADGEYLKVHRLSDYLHGLGKPSDDANNTFTGRLLLVLESAPVFGEEYYEKLVTECIERYWVDHADHSDSFIPAFIINDILRFWRTLCVNYEAGMDASPEKRRAKNYKLKHSRLLTCYSAIIAFQAQLARHPTISQEQALEIVRLSPLDRLHFARDSMQGVRADLFDRAFLQYEAFLRETDCAKDELYEKMTDPDNYRKSLSDARLFGDTIFEIMHSVVSESSIGDVNWRFFRYLTV